MMLMVALVPTDVKKFQQGMTEEESRTSGIDCVATDAQTQILGSQTIDSPGTGENGVIGWTLRWNADLF